ncbi:anaerobic sulfatase maturase [Candidatus Bipolaricaulota bacterium]|nr:anaerobic sulfatase maturase [Candidatus Bipolaricaulota bacterium]MBS3793174.1 anaerobic sulfatase maturase [Candidatus Bipolaricaulota bacterium]
MLDNLLIKPSGPACNLGCSYCFYLNKKVLYPGKTRMDLDTAESMISQLMDSGERATFSWQGGEPTLMGLDFFKEVIELQKKHGRSGQQVTNTIQTNGVLLTEEWADFLSKYNFLVGLSLDGPRDLHDAYRTYPNGEGSFEDVMEAANLLQSKGVEFNILSVINSRTVKQPKRIVNFFLQQDFTHLQFIPAIEVEKGEEGKKIASFSPRPKEVGKFLDTIFSRWSENFPPDFSVRYFDSLLQTSLGRDPGMCKVDAECGSYLVVEHNGDVYPCDFYVEKDKKLGNLEEEPISVIENKEKFKQFSRAKTKFSDKCKDCNYQMYCYGGCQRYRGLPTDPEDRTYLCEAYRYFLARKLEKIKEISSKVRNQKP